MRVIVTGSRTWTDALSVYRQLDACNRPLVVVHGGARSGADYHARLWVMDKVDKAYQLVTEEVHRADWSRGRGAGLTRNAEMVAAGAGLCLAFINQCRLDRPDCLARGPHGSHGADHCAGLARAAGIRTHEFGWRSS